MNLAFVLDAYGCSIAIGSRHWKFAFKDGFVTDNLSKTITNCLNETGLSYADIDKILTTRGPGSFTAVRAALATAQGLAMATGAQLLSPTRLELLANIAPQQQKTLLTIATFRGDYVCQWAMAGQLLKEPFTLYPPQINELDASCIIGDYAPNVDMNEAEELIMYCHKIPSPTDLHNQEPYYVVPLPYRTQATK